MPTIICLFMVILNAILIDWTKIPISPGIVQIAGIGICSFFAGACAGLAIKKP